MSDGGDLSGWDAPFGEDVVREREEREQAMRVVESLREMGFEAGQEVKVDLELVSTILTLWDQAFRADHPDLGSEDEDGDFAWEALLVFRQEEGRENVVLDAQAVSDVVGARETAYHQDYLKHTSEREPPSRLDALTRWASARSEQGDSSAALRGFAQVQEDDVGQDLLSVVYHNRAGVFQESGKLGHALTDIEDAIECDRAEWGMPQPHTLLRHAKILDRLGHHERAVAAALECVHTIGRHLALPRRLEHGLLDYVLQMPGGQTCYVSRDGLAGSVMEVIALVKDLEVRLPDTLRSGLQAVKQSILEVRTVLAEDWRREQRSKR